MPDQVEFHLFLPQMRMSAAAMVERARAAEESGFTGVALMDHLAPPQASEQPMYEAMTMATWLAARTERLTIGHLVLCDSFRHPAVLARQAVTLDHLSEGRYELAIGSGSTPDELRTFGISQAKGADRAARLRETLQILAGLWSGDPVTFHGRFFHLEGARQLPMPTRPIPIVIGGTGPSTLAMARDFATWWNVPTNHIDRLEECRPLVGSARVSLQQMVTLVPRGTDGAAIVAAADRRFGFMGHRGRVVGSGDEVVENFETYRRAGVERFYVWFSDFAEPDTLRAFGTEVIEKIGLAP
jgi:alkanesulfonate monooxygenase SsuD/methylene tetrahydromethanopterin reductase-like flavin-dependent oxidoreductase (luciferase family)